MSKIDRNLEALSAYLDGELQVNERAQIEKMLEQDEDLKSWYEEIKRTRLVLRNTPTLRAPRNYFLTPDMVGQTGKSKWAFPVFRFASAFAALLLVLLYLGDYFVFQSPVMSFERSTLMADSIQSEMEQQAMAPESIESEPQEAPAEPLMLEIPQEEEAAEGAAEENVSPSMVPAPSVAKALPTQMLPSAEAGEMLGSVIEEDSQQLFESRAPIGQSEGEVKGVYDIWLLIRISEVALLIIAISTGIAAIYFYRKS
jgi:hypothetical protein